MVFLYSSLAYCESLSRRGSMFLARLTSSLLEPRLCNSLTDDNDHNDDNDDDDNHKKAQKFEKGKKGK